MFQAKLKFYVLFSELPAKRNSDEEFEFDLFLSCSRENSTYVQEYLIPLLESEPFNLKVCYHHRDFELGQDIIQNMANAVYNSRKILVVISDNYLASEYCLYEMNVALNREVTEKFPCLAFIRRNNMKKNLPVKLKTKNFLDLSNDLEQKFINKRLKSFLRELCKDLENEKNTMNDEQSAAMLKGV